LGGPAVGAIAEAASIRTGLLVAGLMLAPVLPLYSRTLGRGEEAETLAAEETAP
jgi:hypothetical protein